MNRIKRLLEKLVEGILTISGAVTTIIIILITIFLFKEGIGLFQSPNIEKGYGLYVNSENNIQNLSVIEIKQVFDSEITNWEELGERNNEITPYHFERIFKNYTEEELGENYSNLPEILSKIIKDDPNIIAYFPKQYIPTNSTHIKTVQTKNISISDFIYGKEWLPTATPAPLFGLLPLILGTLLISFLAILIALPLGLGVAIYLSELADENIRKFLKPTIELLAGIPSVVYGFFGLVVLVPIIQKAFNIPIGETALTGSILLAIMALPTIISVAEDAMRNTPRNMREASLALGATQWQTIYKVVIPYASPGISAAIILGIGRAIGETMAVLMVTGNAALIPTSIFEPVRTIPATIAAELGESPEGGVHYQALFMLGCILFIITMIISIITESIAKKQTNKGL